MGFFPGALRNLDGKHVWTVFRSLEEAASRHGKIHSRRSKGLPAWPTNLDNRHHRHSPGNPRSWLASATGPSRSACFSTRLLSIARQFSGRLPSHFRLLPHLRRIRLRLEPRVSQRPSRQPRPPHLLPRLTTPTRPTPTRPVPTRPVPTRPVPTRPVPTRPTLMLRLSSPARLRCRGSHPGQSRSDLLPRRRTLPVFRRASLERPSTHRAFTRAANLPSSTRARLLPTHTPTTVILPEVTPLGPILRGPIGGPRRRRLFKRRPSRRFGCARGLDSERPTCPEPPTSVI